MSMSIFINKYIFSSFDPRGHGLAGGPNAVPQMNQETSSRLEPLEEFSFPGTNPLPEILADDQGYCQGYC